MTTAAMRRAKMNNISINSICKTLMKSSRFEIFIHENPDADAIGSCFALINTLRALGKQAYAVSSDKIPSSLLFMTGGVKDFSLEMIPSDFEAETLISVDIASPTQFGAYSELSKNVDIAIDHHATHDSFAKAQHVNASASACAEIIYKIINRLLFGEIPESTAFLLYAGIAADTGGFRYANTTPYTYKVAAKLIERGANHTEICHNLFECKSKAAIAAEAFAMSNVSYFCGGKIIYVKITLADKAAHDFEDEDTYDVINTLRRVDGVKIAIFARERGNGTYKISTRSSCDIDVARICALFGGGGHPGAAGCAVPTADIDSAVKRIVDECKFE